MDFEEIRTELLSHHADLRHQVDAMRQAVEAVSRGDSSHAELRSRTDDLAAALRAHNDREEELLGEVLPTLDAWGAVRREIMTEQHASEHGELADALEGLGSLFERTARDSLLATLDRVLEHMAREEKFILNDPFLRDFGMGSEQISG
jgi:Hemerythrin HHE cation binding domain